MVLDKKLKIIPKTLFHRSTKKGKYPESSEK